MPMDLVAMRAHSKPVDQHNDATVFGMVVGGHTRLKHCCVGKLPLVKSSNHHWQSRSDCGVDICLVHSAFMASSRGGKSWGRGVDYPLSSSFNSFTMSTSEKYSFA